MHRAGRPRFGLHFDNLWDCAPNIFFMLKRPFVRQFTHSTAGGNWINRRKINTSVRDVRRRPVSINNQFRHNNFPLPILHNAPIVPPKSTNGKINKTQNLQIALCAFYLGCAVHRRMHIALLIKSRHSAGFYSSTSTSVGLEILRDFTVSMAITISIARCN